MFEGLYVARSEQAANAANHVIRLIEWRGAPPEILGSKIEWSKNELSETERRLALQLVDEIQENENVPVTDLTESAGYKYISELSDIVDDCIGAALSPAEMARGARILEAWKKGGKVTARNRSVRGIEAETEERPGKARGRRFRAELEKLRDLSDAELREEAARLKQSLFRLNFKLALGEVDAVRNIRQEKKQLARVRILMRERSAEQSH
jgi:large subunit ribosomal protein L29